MTLRISRKISGLLEKMVSKDKDYRLAATNDLMVELQKDSVVLDDDAKRKIVRQLLKLLEDKNGEVRNLAARCLGPLVHKVKPRQLDTIVDTICLISRFGRAIDLNFDELEDPFLMQLEADCPALRKRGIVALSALVDVVSIGRYDRIMNRVLEGFDNAGRNIGYLRTYVSAAAAICRSSSATRFVRFLPEVMSRFVKVVKETEDEELREACLQAFKTFVFRCTTEIPVFVSAIIGVCAEAVQFDPNYRYDEDEDVELNGGIAERMETEGSGSEKPEDKEEGTRNDNYSKDDDMSWKVRRAAAQCVKALVTYRLYDNYNERDERVRYDVFQGYAALLKHTRLYLPDSVVNTAYTPRHTSPPYSEQKFRAVLRDELGEEQRRVFEALETQIPQLMRAINRQLKAKDLKTRRDCFVLLSHLLKHVEKAFPSALKGYFAELTGPIQASMADKASDGNMKISTLHFVKVALHTHEPATLYPHLPVLSALITDAVKDSLGKIAAEALIAVQCLIRVLRPQIGEEQFDFTPFVPSIHDAIHFKLKIADMRDREVKERTVVATGVFIATFADKLTVAQLRGSLALLLDRLRNETTRHVTVKALKTVVRSPLRIDLSAILPEVLPLMADFLRKNQRALKISTLTLLALLVAKFARGGLENRGLTRVAEEVPALIREKDPQISQLSLKFMADLISAYPDQLSDSLQSLLAAVVTITQSSLLQGATLQAALGLLAALVKSPLPKKPSFEALLDRLTSAVYNGQTLHRQAYVSIAKCVAIVALATADMGKTVKLIVQLKGLVTPGQTDSIHLFAVLAIAEIGRIYSALYGKQAARVHPEQVMVGTFGSYSEEVRTAASYTFGSLAVGNLSEYLQFILKGINEDPARRYSLLRTLKEIIISESVSGAASDVFREKVGEIWTVLIGQCDSEEEGTLNVAAECLGELCLVNPQSFLVGMLECVKGMSERMRATAVTAIHFVIADHPMPIGEHLRQVMGQLEIIHESDHHVRRVAMVALNSAAHYKLRMGPRSSSDALRDVFAFGNRFMLDALQIVTRHFDSVVLSMCNVCLRRIDHIWLTHNSYIAVSDERTLSWEWTSDDGGVPRGRSEEISASLRSSLIAHFDIRDLRPTNAFCSIVSEHASHTDIGQLHFQSTDWTNADDHAVALLIGSFASIDRLSFFECTFSSAQVTDDFIRTCIAKRTSDVRISKTKWRSGETRSFSITNDAIMHFCTAPVGGTRMLVADSIPSTEGLFRRIVEAAILGRLTDFIMSLKVADAQNFYNMRDFPTLNVRMEFNRRDHTMRVRSYGRNPVVGEGSVLSGQPI